MSSGKYVTQLNKLKTKFEKYKQSLDEIIEKISSDIVYTVITKGPIANPTPYYNERLGYKLNGKVLRAPVESDDCRKYHYDDENRIIMIEEYSVFLQRFRIEEIFLYNEPVERLLLSSEDLAVLSIFDNPFGKTNTCLSYAGKNGTKVEEFTYDGDYVRDIKITYDEKDEEAEFHKFFYDKTKLIQIDRICHNGYKETEYTTKKPNFKKIREEMYLNLKELIVNHEKEFLSFGVESFIDDINPLLYICFTDEMNPSSLIAEWGKEIYDIQIYDWFFNESHQKKCIKLIKEVIAELILDGILEDKQIITNF